MGTIRIFRNITKEGRWMNNNNTPAQTGGRFALKTLTLAVLCAIGTAHAAPYVESGRTGDPSSWRSAEFQASAESMRLLVADLNATELGAISVDVRRCRYNALVEQDAYDLPVFSPCDDVRPCMRELGDYHWVEIHTSDRRRTALLLLTYFGPGWYGRESVAVMLDAAIITWSNVKTTLNATTRRPASYLADLLKALEQLWLQVGESYAGTQFLEQRGDADRSPQTLAKYASVSLLGLWGRREQYRYTMVTSSYDGDARPGARTTISVTPETPRESLVRTCSSAGGVVPNTF